VEALGYVGEDDDDDESEDDDDEVLLTPPAEDVAWVVAASSCAVPELVVLLVLVLLPLLLSSSSALARPDSSSVALILFCTELMTWSVLFEILSVSLSGCCVLILSRGVGKFKSEKHFDQENMLHISYDRSRRMRRPGLRHDIVHGRSGCQTSL
jgi:hypothetical protein